MEMKRLIGGIKRRATLPALRERVRCLTAGIPYVPPAGSVRFGSLRRLDPLSRNWGEERGGPLDRHYINKFLESHATDVRGRVLEIGDADQTRALGNGQVRQSDVMNFKSGGADTTIVGDLTNAPHIPSDTFDCAIVTQTLQFIFDVQAAIATLHRILKPGGVLLLTVPGISQVNRQDSDSWGPASCWSFTHRSVRMLLEKHFSPGNLEIAAHGNVLAAAGFLFGMGRAEIRPAELDHHDPDYELIITARAQKAAEGGPA